MTSDRPEPATNPTTVHPSAMTPLPDLVIDPESIDAAARHLDDLPAAPSLNLVPPPAEAVGNAGLSTEIDAFYRRYRALVLVTDRDTTAADLRATSDTYRGVETQVAGLFSTDPNTGPNSAHPSTGLIRISLNSVGPRTAPRET
jgi:hypothetical protein